MNSEQVKIIIGPTRQVAASDQELRKLAFQADVPQEDVDASMSGMKEIVRMPLESVMQMLCTVNYILNGEKLELRDIAIYEEEQADLKRLLEQQRANQALSRVTVDFQSQQKAYNTYEVEQLRADAQPSQLVLEVTRYIQHHLSEPISTEDIAKQLYLSRPHLSQKFRKETGLTLTDFILQQKTRAAKRLLRYTDKTSAAIGFYLGFSSQGHFSRVFQKYAGCRPKEYRERYMR